MQSRQSRGLRGADQRCLSAGETPSLGAARMDAITSSEVANRRPGLTAVPRRRHHRDGSSDGKGTLAGYHCHGETVSRASSPTVRQLDTFRRLSEGVRCLIHGLLREEYLPFVIITHLLFEVQKEQINPFLVPNIKRLPSSTMFSLHTKWK
ncbi:hypothetical protein E2C01_083780 [Portunus trituberculatus]|uniref:Uncharacterized protein n=1 Tax=Portunus trituberculatus TaxID=210409 RepID=A0A5B7J7F7_PORTR|nr:hypothetical protein [Portunus trituberculatus]